MRNVTGQAVMGEDLYGRDYELARLWGKFRSNLLREWWRKHHGGVAP